MFESAAQTILGRPRDFAPLFKDSQQSAWMDTLTYPAYASCFSIFILLLRLAKVKRSSTEVFTPENRVQDYPGASFFRKHVANAGGSTIFSFLVLRLTACLVFLVLSAASLFINLEDHQPNTGEKSSTLNSEGPKMAMFIVAVYISLLSLISVVVNRMRTKGIIRHLNFLSFTIFGVYFYRDVFPLMTYDREPMDLSEGWMMWGKCLAVTIAAVVVPLCIPRQYSPVGPKDSREPTPEQACSILSLATYSFLDSFVWLAYRSPTLTPDQLPPLSGNETTKVLVETNFQYIDSFGNKRKRHLFFGLMRVFRVEFICLVFVIILQVFVTFLSPIGLYQLLRYLETGGTQATIRPWVWILWLLLGPIAASTVWEFYIFIATRNIVRAEALLSELILEHALRVRMKAELDQPSIGPVVVPDPVDNNEGLDLQADSESLSETLHEGPGAPDSTSSTDAKVKNTSIATAPESTVTTSKPSRSSNLIGKINNLVTTDLVNITEAHDFLKAVLWSPLQITLCIVFLYQILGWSALAGFGFMLITFPIPGYIAKMMQGYQVAVLEKSDARAQSVTETMSVIRMIKMFGWESKMDDRIAAKREEELLWIRSRQFLQLGATIVSYVVGNLTMVVTFATYAIVMRQELNASKVFSSMTVFNMLAEHLRSGITSFNQSVKGKVSLDRVNDFLQETELLDEFDETRNEPDSGNHQDTGMIGFRDASFTWSKDTPMAGRNFTLRIIGDLLFHPGCVNLIVGQTGSGKTSLLLAMLGEMHFVPSGPNSSYSLPRSGGVAYAAQESWVQNETIRDNILFGAPFDEVRYNKVIHQCALRRDIDMFGAGDRTEVGEKGVTLSGGQKARITLARAVYSSAQILLLDDILSAVDVHTSKWIVEKCLGGDLIQGRTVILVTHNVALATTIAHFVVSVKNGRIVTQEKISQVLEKDSRLAAEVEEGTEILDAVVVEEGAVLPEAKGKNADGKLMAEEEVQVGHVGWTAIKLYLSGMSQMEHFPVALFWIGCLGFLILNHVLIVLQTWYLGFWASQYQYGSHVNVAYYLGVYCFILGLIIVMYAIANIIYFFGTLRASRTIHSKLIKAVLGTTLRWLDTTPTSRIITRCTQDMRTVDGLFGQLLQSFTEMSLSMIAKIIGIMLFTPIYLVPGVFVFAMGVTCGKFYITAQLYAKREDSNAKSPVLGHLGAAIAGLTSIRAYGAQESFKTESKLRLDRLIRAGRTFYNLNRWIGVRIQALGACFSAGLAAWLVYGQPLETAGDTGFSLNMAVTFSSMILWWIRILNRLEVQGNSLERIQSYVSIEQEPKSTEAGTPPAHWPASGDLRVEKLSARYSWDGPTVLHDISFHVKSGQRVGIVGRTGSGKSSLTLALMRCIITDGQVFFDDRMTAETNLDTLRSNITIIPQIPELLSGTLRSNLDPFGQYDDAVLNDALRSAGLFSLQTEGDDSKITLDTAISSSGTNISIGQRQILALARAILRRSKLLILDEATSAIDYETDSVIQTSLRNELNSGVTVLTIAHRLSSIMDADMVLVLDGGRLVESGMPYELMIKEDGHFRQMCLASGTFSELRGIAKVKAGILVDI